jgi:hypothetical protein
MLDLSVDWLTLTLSKANKDLEMATAAATTNEQGKFFNTTFTIGYSGHGGLTKSCYSDFKKKSYMGEYPIINLRGVEATNPSALTELLKSGVTGSTKVTHQIAYHVKTNKKGKKYDSHLGEYISFKVGGKKVSALIKGYSCIFFIDDKKVTNIFKVV